MNISEYRNRGRRPITLPSGLEGFVRPPTVMDVAAHPRLLLSSMEGGAKGGAEGAAAVSREWIRMVLRRCFIPRGGVMSEEEPGLCGPAELSVHELAPGDATAILDAVTALTGGPAGKESPSAGGPFPRGGAAGAEGTAGAPPSPGPDLRPSPPPAGPGRLGGVSLRSGDAGGGAGGGA